MYRPEESGRIGDLLQLTSLSFAHPAVPAEHRAQLSLPGNALQDAHGRLRSAGYQAFFLSTCLRVEIVWVGESDAVPGILASLYEAKSPDRGALRSGPEAFVHLCRVAAGLDSPSIGEPEVLGQFRQAVATCQDVYESLGSLGRVLEAAVGIGRNARRLLGDAPRGSLAALAGRAAAPFGQVAILGGGAMARAALERLNGIPVSIFTRRPGTVAGHETLEWDKALQALATHPVVISTVPGKIPLFPQADLARTFAQRQQPLLLIDLGMPPGFSRPGDAALVEYLGVDEVANSANSRPASSAEEALARVAEATWRRLTAPDRVGTVIAAMMERVETAVSEEVRRFANRLPGASDPERVLSQLARTVAHRVLHPPIFFLGSTDRGPDAVDVVAEAFGVDVE